MAPTDFFDGFYSGLYIIDNYLADWSIIESPPLTSIFYLISHYPDMCRWCGTESNGLAKSRYTVSILFPLSKASIHLSMTANIWVTQERFLMTPFCNFPRSWFSTIWGMIWSMIINSRVLQINDVRFIDLSFLASCLLLFFQMEDTSPIFQLNDTFLNQPIALRSSLLARLWFLVDSLILWMQLHQVMVELPWFNW